MPEVQRRRKVPEIGATTAIAAGDAGGVIEITVDDDGPGIPEPTATTAGLLEFSKATLTAIPLVADAARDGLTVRPVGSGHSFTPLCATDGVLLGAA